MKAYEGIFLKKAYERSCQCSNVQARLRSNIPNIGTRVNGLSVECTALSRSATRLRERIFDLPSTLCTAVLLYWRLPTVLLDSTAHFRLAVRISRLILFCGSNSKKRLHSDIRSSDSPICFVWGFLPYVLYGSYPPVLVLPTDSHFMGPGPQLWTATTSVPLGCCQF